MRPRWHTGLKCARYGGITAEPIRFDYFDYYCVSTHVRARRRFNDDDIPLVLFPNFYHVDGLYSLTIAKLREKAEIQQKVGQDRDGKIRLKMEKGKKKKSKEEKQR